MPRSSGIKTGRWSVRFLSGLQHHGPNLHSEANLREIFAVWQRSLCMLCRSWKSIWPSSLEYTLVGFAGVWRLWSVVTRHLVIVLPSGKWQAIKTVQCGHWTPSRLRFVTSPFHCLHELDWQMQPSWWVCHDWKLQNQSSSIRWWFGTAFFHRIWPPVRFK